MRGIWRWLITAALAFEFVRTTVSAFSVPWTWNIDQWLFLLLALAACSWVATWLVIWLKGGTEGIKRYRLLRREQSKARDPQIRRWSLVFWIGVALALVVYFNLTQH